MVSVDEKQPRVKSDTAEKGSDQTRRPASDKPVLVYLSNHTDKLVGSLYIIYTDSATRTTQKRAKYKLSNALSHDHSSNYKQTWKSTREVTDKP